MSDKIPERAVNFFISLLLGLLVLVTFILVISVFIIEIKAWFGGY